MPKANSQYRLTPYSETVSSEDAKMIRRIQPVTEGSFFQTRVFTAPGGTAEWRAAYKNEQNDLWDVYHYKTKDGFYTDEDGQIVTDDQPLTQNELLSAACLYDALHACATFEVSETQEALDKTPAAPSREALGQDHYRAFGEAQGIVFDKKTFLPVPVCDGRIMGENPALGAHDLEIAKRARGNMKPCLEEEKENALARAQENAKAAAVAQKKQALVKACDQQTKRSVTALHKKQARFDRKLGKLRDAFALVCDAKGAALATKLDNYEIKCAYAVGAGTLLSGPIMAMASNDLQEFMVAGSLLSLIAYASIELLCMAESETDPFEDPLKFTKNCVLRPQRRFEKALKTMRRELETLPQDSARYQDTKALLDDIDLSYRKLQARFAFQRASRSESFLSRYRLKKAYDKLGMPHAGHVRATLSHPIKGSADSEAYSQEIRAEITNKLAEYEKRRPAYYQEEERQALMKPEVEFRFRPKILPRI